MAFMSNSFHLCQIHEIMKPTHQIWSCHVTLASNSENFYLLPNSISNCSKCYQIWGNWLNNKKLQAKKTNLGGGKKNPPSAYRVNGMKALSIGQLQKPYLSYGHNRY